MAQKARNEHLDPLEDFLSELARVLLAAGISFPQFEAIAQAAFVTAALERTKLSNSRTNQSAIAAITGITRIGVRRILKAGSAQQRLPYRGPLLSVLFGWTSDPEFINAEGGPRALPRRGRYGSFQRLAKIYGRDVSGRALLGELERMKLVDVRKGAVTLRTGQPASRQTRELNALTAALARTLQLPVRPTVSPVLRVEGGEVSFLTPSKVGRVLLKRRVRQGLDAFLADVRTSAVAAHRAPPRTMKKSDRMSKVSVLVVSQD